MRILSLSASFCLLLLLTSCTGKQPDGPPPDSTSDDAGIISPSDDAGMVVKTCASCGANQVCVDGACVGIPSSCPCPKETYCDLATTSCKVGCTSDSECSTGRICDTNKRTCFVGCRSDSACGGGQICDNLSCRTGCRSDATCGSGNICNMANNTCVAGCRKDLDCGGGGKICDTVTSTCQSGCRKDSECTTAGQICDTTVNMCRTGCRTTATCAKEQVCDSATKKCVAGCDGDARCNTGRICESSMCTDGCRSDATCPLNTYCDEAGTKKCMPGCDRDPSRCAVGEACVGYVDGSSKCQLNCYGWTCNGMGWECFKQGSDSAGARCRQTCFSDTDCTTSGHRCTWFTKSISSPSSYDWQYCAKPCTVAGCATCIDPYGMYGTTTCSATTKACQFPAGGVGYQTSPSYGL